MLSNVTIVVPTRKRYSYLLRLLKFYQCYNLDLKILVLDSTPYDPSNDELIKLLSSQNILWKKYDSDLPFWDRISKGTEFIETEYVTMCGDDDFIIPAALTECVDFLRPDGKPSRHVVPAESLQ